MATTTIQIQDTADTILDEYKDQIGEQMPGVTVNKGQTGTDAIVQVILPKLSAERQKRVLKAFPELARFINGK